MIVVNDCVGRVAKCFFKAWRTFDAAHRGLSSMTWDKLHWFQYVHDAREVMCPCELARRGIVGCTEFCRQFHGRFNAHWHVRCELLERSSLKQRKAREIIGFSLKLIGDRWRECLIAILKKSKNLAMRREFMEFAR